MSTIPTIRDEHFRGGSNLTKGNRVDSDAILEEIVKAAKVDILAVESRTSLLESAMEQQIWVDGSVATTGDGSYIAPFKTVQEGFDAISRDGQVLHIMPGTYDESVVHQHKYNLAVEGHGLVQIWPSTAGGPALVLTNATRASVTTYLGSRVYTDLIYDPTVGGGALLCNITNVGCTGQGAGNYGLEFLGVPGDASATTTAFGSNVRLIEGFASASGGVGGIHARNCWAITLELENRSTSVFCYNCGQITLAGAIGAITGDYDPASAFGNTSFPGTKGAFQGQQAFINGNFTFTGNCKFTSYGTDIKSNVSIGGTSTFQGRAVSIGGTLTVADTAVLSAVYDLTVAGAVSVEVGASLTANAPHMASTLAVAGTCVLNGGEVMGVVSGAGSITHNLGTIGV